MARVVEVQECGVVAALRAAGAPQRGLEARTAAGKTALIVDGAVA